MANAFRGHQRLVEGRDGAIDIACTRLGFSERNLEEPIEGQMLFRQQFGGAPHVLETVAGPAAFSPRQAIEKNRVRSPRWQIVLARESGELNGVLRGAREVAVHQRE